LGIKAVTDPNAGVGQIVANEIGKGDTAAAIFANAGGIARNPHKVLLFQGVGFRQHRFDYQFQPKSYDEAVMLRGIINFFKYAAAPSYNAHGVLRTGDFINNIKSQAGSAGSLLPDNVQNINIDASAGKHFFKYPYYFRIAFNHSRSLFTIAPSVLDSVSIDYHPAGIPSYARSQNNDPSHNDPTQTQTNISLHFTETEIVTKEGIDQGR